jgi:hypothetical protein
VTTKTAVLVGLLCVVSVSSKAAVIGGVDFPEGAVSFVDSVVSYSPGLVGSNPIVPHRGAVNALGVPDYAGDPGDCTSQATCTHVALGDGGNIVLRFVDNLLTGSGTPAADLWIFEIGGDVEDTFVEISADGSTWNAVGKVFGSQSGVDIDAFGFGVNSSFSYVRLTDDPQEGQQSGSTVGADIDAVGAISTTPTAVVPEPSTVGLAIGGLLALLLAGGGGRAKSRR